ncbi:MAG: hypothetical protein HY775_00815 [Acidobacteria bacterium]|nr:hypothetical protein [Acidobacteriota bacterium]
MAQTLIRDLPDEVVARLKARAKRNHRSLEAELRLILEREALWASAAREPAPSYRTGPAATRGRAKPEPGSSGIRIPQGRRRFGRLEPIKAKGTPASRLLVSERR